MVLPIHSSSSLVRLPYHPPAPSNNEQANPPLTMRNADNHPLSTYRAALLSGSSTPEPSHSPTSTANLATVEPPFSHVESPPNHSAEPPPEAPTSHPLPLYNAVDDQVCGGYATTIWRQRKRIWVSLLVLQLPSILPLLSLLPLQLRLHLCI